MMSLLRIVQVLVLAAIIPLAASAQGALIGVTYNPMSENGMGFGVQLDIPVYTFNAGDQLADLTVRGTLSAPFSFDLYPNIDVAIGVRIPSPEADIYVATGAGVWWSVIDEEPCYDITWIINGGIDVKLNSALALRVEVQSAPLVSQFVAGFGLAVNVGR
jgi:hypothetical protein